jgi:predicted RNA-binding Zn ribbon-like protein
LYNLLYGFWRFDILKDASTRTGPPARPFRRIGGALCLDFANTANWRAAPAPEERLGPYGDLVAWGRQAELAKGAEAKRLLEEARARPAAAGAALRRAVGLRETIYRTFAAVAGGRRPAPRDLASLNEAVGRAMGRPAIVPAGRGFAWAWAGDEGGLDSFLAPVARSAAELLLSPEAARVRQCADDRGCGWLFVDRSKNRSRRWCDMKDCGNRAKARRHHRRRRGR